MKKNNLEKVLVILLASFVWMGCSNGTDSGQSPSVTPPPEAEEPRDNAGEGVTSPDPNEEPAPAPAPATPLTPSPPPAPAPAPEPNFTFSALWEEANQNNHEWTLLTANAIDNAGENLMTIVPEDIEDFCPNYEQLNLNYKKQFWIHFMSTIARFESNFRPEVSFVENFNDRHGNPVVSRGLLQLSVESGRGYRCVIPEEEDLHDPEVNLTCGIRIINRWVGRDGAISKQVTLSNGNRAWRGGARYWAVLRKSSRLNAIKDLNSKQSYCQTN